MDHLEKKLSYWFLPLQSPSLTLSLPTVLVGVNHSATRVLINALSLVTWQHGDLRYDSYEPVRIPVNRRSKPRGLRIWTEEV